MNRNALFLLLEGLPVRWSALRPEAACRPYRRIVRAGGAANRAAIGGGRACAPERKSSDPRLTFPVMRLPADATWLLLEGSRAFMAPTVGRAA